MERCTIRLRYAVVVTGISIMGGCYAGTVGWGITGEIISVVGRVCLFSGRRCGSGFERSENGTNPLWKSGTKLFLSGK